MDGMGGAGVRKNIVYILQFGSEDINILEILNCPFLTFSLFLPT